MIPSTRATITAVAAAVIAVTGYLGTRYLAAGVLACIVAMAVGFPYLTRVTRPRVTSAIIVGGGLLALVAVVLGRNAPYLRYMTVAVAAVTVAASAAEVFWPARQGRAVTYVAATASGGAIAASGAAWVAVARTNGAADLVVCGGVALAVAAVASVMTTRPTVNTLGALGLGTLSGGFIGYLFPALPWYAGLLIGLVCAVAAVLIQELYRREPRPRGWWTGIAAGVAPVLVAGALVYIAGRLVLG
jgi:hypothetical protein